jgi:hypothetical protein
LLLANSAIPEVCLATATLFPGIPGGKVLAATPFKNLNGLCWPPDKMRRASSSTAFQWSSKVVPHPAGGQVLVSLSSAQLDRIPCRVWFFLLRQRIFVSAAFMSVAGARLRE